MRSHLWSRGRGGHANVSGSTSYVVDVELVTKKEVLDFQLPPRFERIRDEHRKQMEDGKPRI